GDFKLAEHLWTRVLALSPADPKALKALRRIWVKLEQTAKPPLSESIPESGNKSRTITPPRYSEEVPQSPLPQGILNLQSFKFDVVTVDSQGKEINRNPHQAKFFAENLGNGVMLEMVAIPRGKFLMGSPTSEPGDRIMMHYVTSEEERCKSESPQHSVTIQPFFMGKHPVTQAQWKAVVPFPKVNRNLKTELSQYKGDNLPVEQVSWSDAVEFCDRLSKKTGRTYRLPSEAEWEYACRAGTTTPFHFGETITTDLANYDGNRTYRSEAKGEYRAKTTLVGHFSVANLFGLYDMHGNVWEWCADSRHPNYEGAPTDGSVWQDDNDNNYRLLRGGSWVNYPASCRSAFRYLYYLGGRYGNSFGFRVVCETAPTL
ncbi:MAG: formylglycine-generating enzyme family protein, partial [Symploca sp. SIO2E6]|nr:formylglycine-generating enzyme family protein [Symploca sp. SIO2E6]